MSRTATPAAPVAVQPTREPDLVIVGGGVIGLWCAYFASRSGLRCLLIEKCAHPGSGASGGLLGALMPHQPMNWNAEKQLQYESLLELESLIATVEDETGIACGYHRCGRLIPTVTERKRRNRRHWQVGAESNWKNAAPSGTHPEWHLFDHVPDPAWLSPELARFGCEVETLSARVEPRCLIEALTAAIDGKVALATDHAVAGIEATRAGPRLRLADATTLMPGRVIIAAGHEAFELTRPLVGRSLGRGVKGQAALFESIDPLPAASPIIYYDGTYAIAHQSRFIAVGSTTEYDFTEPLVPDGTLDEVIAKARTMCPPLQTAVLRERWAGLRPKAIGRKPIVDELPDAPGCVIASGGFKISLGIAPRLARAALAACRNEPLDLPENYSVPFHMACGVDDETA